MATRLVGQAVEGESGELVVGLKVKIGHGRCNIELAVLLERELDALQVPRFPMQLGESCGRRCGK